MSTRQDKAKEIIEKSGLSQAWVAQRLGYTAQNLSYHLNQAAELDRDIYEKILNLLERIGKITETESSEPGNIPNIKVLEDNIKLYPYPLIATVSAGPGVFDATIPQEQYYMDFKPNGHRLYAVKVDGNSMDSTIPDGSIVLVDMDLALTNNCVAVIKLSNGKQYIKRYKDLNYEFISLHSDNRAYEPFIIAKKDIECIHKVVRAVIPME
jgi:phage repressor protein C with HTH and peptisase S24 domain